MNLPVFEGFNNYGTDPADLETGLLVRAELWNSAPNVGSCTFDAINGGRSLQLNTTGGACSLNSNAALAQPTHIVGGFRFMRPGAGSFEVQKDFFYGYLGSQFEDYFRFSFFPEGPTDYTVITTVLSYQDYAVNDYIYNIAAGVWHYIEFELDLSTTVVWKVRFNGNLVVDKTFPRGQLAGYLRDVRFRSDTDSSGATSNPKFNDFYLLDANDASYGPALQAFLGPIEIRPSALVLDGLSEWIPQGAGTRRETVDELPANDKDTSYVTTSQAPSKQRFLTQAQLDKTALAVQTTAVIKQLSPTPAVAQLVLEAYKGTDLSEVAKVDPLQAVYRALSTTFATLPDGSSLTKANIDATEWGVRVDASS